MKTSIVLLFSLLVCGALTAAQSQEVSNVKAADFGWMTGRWIGHLANGATAEQICSTAESGEMLCLFRVFVGGRPAMYELYTLFDTATGLELRSLHFAPDLSDKVLQSPLVMKLQKYSAKEVVFAGTPESEIETSTLLRDSPSTMNGVIMFRNNKEPHIRVRWEKVAYDAKVDYNRSSSGPSGQ